ncbi:MAG: DUF4162 domain-containing protein, partial [Bacteroidota bacterium]
FVTTHYMDEAEHCNTIGFIYAGKLIALAEPTSLKKRLDRYTIYEVYCDRTVEAMELLQGEPWCVETSIFGSAFHVSTFGLEKGDRQIAKLLEGKGFEVERIQPIEPSLEDVFIHLIAEEDRKRSGSEKP